MSKLPPIIVAAALAFISPSAAHASPVSLSTFDFTGTCNPSGGGNCTGTGTGTLVLQNYTLGTNITTANIDSFTYHSNLVSLSLTGFGSGSGQISGIGGCFGSSCVPSASLPGPADVSISVLNEQVFESLTIDGLWCATNVGSRCGITDFGNAGTWSETPLPAALPLFATGLGGLGLLGWRRKRKAQAVAVSAKQLYQLRHV